MAGENPGAALGMVERVEQMCRFIENPKIQQAALDLIPVCMPRDVRSHVDLSFWVGLGTVGLWAALDAFSQREGLRTKCGTCNRDGCIVPRFSSVQRADLVDALEELEDLRHLYAHNYGGEADDVYFKYKRHVLARGGVPLMTCGVPFDGQRAQLDLSHLRHYCGVARSVLETA